jgi:ATP-dependent DNA ligase
MLWRTPSKVRPAAGFIEPCIPTLAAKPPFGPQWVYEIKHDGYRLMVRAVVFDHACRMGLEDIVAKRLDLPYRSGKAKCWVKVKNPKSPAMLRVEDGTW